MNNKIIHLFQKEVGVVPKVNLSQQRTSSELKTPKTLKNVKNLKICPAAGSNIFDVYCIPYGIGGLVRIAYFQERVQKTPDNPYAPDNLLTTTLKAILMALKPTLPP